jgi:hypothetical protein
MHVQMLSHLHVQAPKAASGYYLRNIRFVGMLPVTS